jgi:hypothetical protein
MRRRLDASPLPDTVKGLRSASIGLLKRFTWRAMRFPLGFKLAQLVSEEWAQAAHFAAIKRSAARLDETLDLSVQRGPFAGMTYHDYAAVGSTLYPKLLGSYERELHQTVEDIVRLGYETVVDIGAAEGYYAVGLAMRMPGAKVIAFEMHPAGQTAIRAMATRNGVSDRVRVLGIATRSELAALDVSGRVLVISDCEGAEYELLESDSVPWLRDADLLIEVHQFHGIDGRAELGRRFRATHDIEPIDVRRRDSSFYPELSALLPADRDAVLFERTDYNGWLWCSSRRNAARV